MDIHPSQKFRYKERDPLPQNPLLGAVVVKIERYDDVMCRTANALITLRTPDGAEICLHGRLSDYDAISGVPAVFQLGDGDS